MKKQTIPPLPEKTRELREIDWQSARELVQAALDKRDLGFRELATGMGISRSYVGYLMLGEREWSPTMWANCWNFLNTVKVEAGSGK